MLGSHSIHCVPIIIPDVVAVTAGALLTRDTGLATDQPGLGSGQASTCMNA